MKHFTQAPQSAPKGLYNPLTGVYTPAGHAQSPKSTRSFRLGLLLSVLFCVGLVLAGLLLGTALRLRQTAGVAAPLSAPPSITPLPKGTAPQQALPSGLTTVEITQKVAPSVVSLAVYEQGELGAAGSGSGIVFTQDGYILTNYHVVVDAFAIRVVLHNGEGYTATLVEKDILNDLAVIKIDATGLTPAEFGDSDQVEVGETAIVIGNAAGMLPGSPTQGIISGINREITVETADGRTATRLYLQTDAAINPGNSGGALVNRFGQVIGVSVAKLSSEAIDNIGFAIPIKTALPLMQELSPGAGLPAKPRIGVTVRELNETNGPANGLPTWGLYIEAIAEDSNLNDFPVQAGDVIMMAEETSLLTMEDLDNVLYSLKPGDIIRLLILKAKTGDTVWVSPVLL